MPTLNSVPARRREHHFRAVEGALKEVVAGWPTPVVFDPHPYSTETFAKKLREGAKSYIEYLWKSELDPVLLRTVIGAWQVRCKDDGKVVVCPADYEDSAAAVQAGEVVNPSTKLFDLVLDREPEEVVQAAILLVHYRKLKSVRVRPHNPTTFRQMLSLYQQAGAAPDPVGGDEGWLIVC